MSGAENLHRPHDAITARAADYFERQRFGEWSEKDQAELDAWFAQSILHEVAYLRLKGAVARTEKLAAHRPAASGATVQRGIGKLLRGRFALPLLAAASISLFAALGIPFVNAVLQPSPERTYSTEVGGRALLKFADGTLLDLDTNTSVHFRISNEERTVWLDRGEAWFHVSHDAAHPFTVVVGTRRVTDLGTEFLVRRGPDDMKVALLSGRASLSTEGEPAEMLLPGDEAVATAVSLSVTRKTPQELADELAWRRGVLVFRSTRFADAVREVNRYNTTRLVIADPSLADMTFSGEISNDNYESFLRIAQTMMKLHIDRQGKDILISRASARPEKAKAAGSP